MKATLNLAALCTSLCFVVSCASLNLGGGEQPAQENAEVASSLDGGSAIHDAPSDAAYAAPEMAESPAPAVQPEVLNAQRSESELDAAAPETSTDTFHASTQTPGMEEVVPSQLPPKTGASWDKQASALPTYEEPKQEKSYSHAKKSSSKKIAKKSSKQQGKLAKHSKKSKKDIAKNSKHSKKSIAKKSKVDCKKIAKNTKKAKKTDVAMCKMEKKKLAQKSKKMGKVASAGRSGGVRE